MIKTDLHCHFTHGLKLYHYHLNLLAI